MNDLNKKLPTIPQYFKQYVDNDIDLEVTSSLPCPFHNEKSGKSFSYSKQLGIWRCFGACHCGGDVVDLHRLHYKFKTKDEALKSLCKICGIDIKQDLSFEKEEVEVNPEVVYRRRIYALSISLAKDVDDWLELDYIMSKVPYDVKELELFCSVRGHIIENK